MAALIALTASMIAVTRYHPPLCAGANKTVLECNGYNCWPILYCGFAARSRMKAIRDVQHHA
eukprot:1014083-Amphidinium_carterae.1